MGVNNLFIWITMSNPIKNWFFELIEDAIGSKAMQQFKKEEETKKNLKGDKQTKRIKDS